jgi:protein SCO1/2
MIHFTAPALERSTKRIRLSTRPHRSALVFIFALLASSLVSLIASPNAHAAHQEPLPFYDSSDLTPYWVSDKDSVARKPVVLSAFRVVDQNSKPVTEQNMKKQIALVNFFFATCPGLCPTMMRTLSAFEKGLGKVPVQIYSFSVSPQVDTPERLSAYTKKHDLDASYWSLLTGDEKEIFRVGKDDLKADGAVGPQKKKSAFIHTANVYLIDPSLRLRGIYKTTSSEEMKLLAKDLARLRTEKN